MQSRAQRRQYGEPVERLSLSVRYGQRHTRGLEAELESVTRSALQIRSPRVHVPLRSSRVASGCPKRNSQPIKPLQQPNATPVRMEVGWCRDATGCARGSSRPWYARRRPWRSLLNGRSLDRHEEALAGDRNWGLGGSCL